MSDAEKALEKLDREWQNCGSVGGTKSVVNKPVYHMLRGFCQADGEFASLIASSDKTLKQCLEDVHKAVKSGWSDYAVFSRAVSAYVPGAKIRVMMEIDMNGDIDAGVAFGKDAAATEKMYHDEVKTTNWEPKTVKRSNTEKSPEAQKPKQEAPQPSAKVLPPPNVAGNSKAETTEKPTQAKVIRFNLLDTL